MTERMEWAQARLTEFLRSRDMDPFQLAVQRLQEALYGVEYCPNDDKHDCCVTAEDFQVAIKALDTEIDNAEAAFEDYVSRRAS